MIVGIPREIKDKEYRVSMTPGAVEQLVHDGNTVFVESEAGLGSGFGDGEYELAGARLLGSGAEVYAASEMVVKVKEPLPEEYRCLRPGLVLFTYLHLAANPNLTEALLESGVSALGY